jgi:hypothetical protein
MRRPRLARRKLLLLSALAGNGVLWQVALAGPVGPVPTLALILAIVDAVAVLILIVELTGFSVSGPAQGGQGLTLQDDAAYRQAERLKRRG